MNNMAGLPRTEFATALAQIAAEKGLDKEVVLETIKAAILAAYRRDAREKGVEIDLEQEFEVEMDPDSGEARVWEIRQKKRREVTPPGFGRIAAQTAKQVLRQKIREAEKSAILEEYSQRIGTLVSGMILRFDGPNIVVDIGKTEALMPPSEQVRKEGYKLNQRLTFYLKEISETSQGERIIVSRASEKLVERLFKREVPEVSSGAIEIVKIAREPGLRTKMAVSSNQAGVDPIGSCVGQKGVRVQEVINELGGEKIDIILYSEEPSKFIAASLSPAEGIKVKIDEEKKQTQVTVPEDQLSLAIGKDGQNVRLAAKLTGFKIDVVGEKETGKKEVAEKEEKKKEKKAAPVKKEKKKKKETAAKAAGEKAKKTKKTKKTKKDKKKDTNQKDKS